MSAIQTRIRFVRDVMSKEPVCAFAHESAHTLAKMLDENDISGMPVVDAQERVIGVVSKTDLLHRCIEGPITSRAGSFFAFLAEGLDADIDPDELGSIQDMMTEDPYCVSPDDPVGEVAHRMSADRIHRAIVVDEARRAVGIVTSLDLLRAVPRSE